MKNKLPEDIVELVKVVIQLDPTSFALMQNDAELLLVRDKLARIKEKSDQ